jgi:hypothetical protein
MDNDSQNSVKLTATVIGGGLAGLVSSLKLVSMGISVNLYESSQHLGGKAASLNTDKVYDGKFKQVSGTLANGIRSDHGYHVFPKWYYNMRALWEEIGLKESDVIESGDYLGLEKNTHYVFTQPQDWSEAKVKCILDLVRKSDDEVDNLTCRGFFYANEHNKNDDISLNDLFLNALSIPEYDISARATRDLFIQWLPVKNKTNWDALKGDLSSVLIDKLVATIREKAEQNNCHFIVHFGHQLKRIKVNKDALHLNFRHNYALPVDVTCIDQPTVMAIPMEVLRGLQSDKLFEREPATGNLNFLRANQYSALDIYFNEKLPNIPSAHFDLSGSEYNLSAFDISQHWPVFTEEKAWHGTVLQFVTGNCKKLVGLSEKKLMQSLVAEIGQYIPAANAKGIAYIVSHPNFTLPLFVNDVGTWSKRPSATGSAKADERPGAFYFAGDYTQNITDITSMEGAVRSGLNAAEAIRQAYCPWAPPINIKPPTSENVQKLALILGRKNKS